MVLWRHSMLIPDYRSCCGQFQAKRILFPVIIIIRYSTRRVVTVRIIMDAPCAMLRVDMLYSTTERVSVSRRSILVVGTPAASVL